MDLSLKIVTAVLALLSPNFSKIAGNSVPKLNRSPISIASMKKADANTNHLCVLEIGIFVVSSFPSLL